MVFSGGENTTKSQMVGRNGLQFVGEKGLQRRKEVGENGLRFVGENTNKGPNPHAPVWHPVRQRKSESGSVGTPVH
ncbi:hypothetical protein GCM10027275_42180 [Rhabdobacter roseus]